MPTPVTQLLGAPVLSHACSANVRAVASPTATPKFLEKRTELLAMAPGWWQSTTNPHPAPSSVSEEQPGNPSAAESVNPSMRRHAA